MKNKQLLKGFNGILLMILVITGIVLFSVFQLSGKKNLQNVLNESISFTQQRVVRYKNYRDNDQIKSLVRLRDKAEALSWAMAGESDFDEQRLKEYADDQRISGILVLDENLQTVMQVSEDGTTENLWKDMIENAYVKDILEHPKKTYITRLTTDDAAYDFAAVSRQDAKGLIITYLQRCEAGDAAGDLSMETLLADFPFEMQGVVVICEDDLVVGSNQSELIGKTVEECKELYQGSFESDKDGIVRLKSGSTVWYGRRDAAENYSVYMFFPAFQIFMTRNIVCMIYVLVAIMIFMVQMLDKNRTEKAMLLKEQKRLRIIKAIGQAYFSIYLVDLKTQKLEVIKNNGEDIPEKEDLHKLQLTEYAEHCIDQSSRADYLEFIDMTTVVTRLKEKEALSFTCQKTDGSFMLTLIVPQRYDEHGNIDAVLIANRDVTAEKKHEMEQDEALRNALAVAEHASKAKSTFLSSMSHDIRTPMNAIIGFTALAQTHMDEPAQVQDYLAKISTSSTHLLSLINDILDMSRIESGTVKLDEKPVHIPDILHDLRAMIQGLVNSKSLNLYIDAQDVVNEDVIVDKLRLNQILLNIVSNAIKFTEPGGDIIVRLIEKPCEMKQYTTYELSVKDNGIGMSKDFIEHVFDTFAREQSSTVSGIQGTGLGMAITKNIVEMMGGEITVESEEGKGTVFTVTLHLRLADEPVQLEPIPALLGARALVVDDDLNTCRSVSKMLRDIKMRPDWTASGKEAIVRAQDAAEMKDEYQVYIIDYLMPDMNGIETVRRIRKVISADVPIIVLTAYDWADFEYEARQAGVTAFVSKPIFLSELRKVLMQPVNSKGVANKAQNDADKKQYDYSGKRILLVEDNELNREIATAILEETGMTIDSVDDGDVAVAAINEAPADKYDLVLMDIQMPKMDGYTATREIRTLSDNRKANIPIVAMTANAFEEDKQRAYKAGMNGHIIKPVSIEAIAKVLHEIFKEKDGAI